MLFPVLGVPVHDPGPGSTAVNNEESPTRAGPSRPPEQNTPGHATYLPTPHTHSRSGHTHSRNSSLDMRISSRSTNELRSGPGRGCHSRAASLDLRHTRNSSADLNKLFRNDLGLVFGSNPGTF